jgi:hypothetical protein
VQCLPRRITQVVLFDLTHDVLFTDQSAEAILPSSAAPVEPLTFGSLKLVANQFQNASIL